jgi:D-alanyl-D-alanine carboxypeptidase/D-alanyl-D-alanine-endopeptidase (penicillin-binding protein 4)
LPYSGEPELRWSKRLAEPPYRGNVFAKTGTLNGVSALSGYAKGKSGRLYAFSILCNRTRSNWEAVRVQDRIVRALIDQG